MRKTKILATLGPSSGSDAVIEALMLAGMSGVRINFSHGTYDSHSEIINRVKAARKKLGKPIPLLLDTKGPEIRTKAFENGAISLEKDDEFTLTTREVKGDKTAVSITYGGLPKDLKEGDKILLDDGLIEMTVKTLTETDITCLVQNGGNLGSNKGINVPGVYVNLPALTEKDEEDVKFGIKMGFDYVAASFVRSANDVFAIRHVLEENGGSDIEIIAKIENRDGVKNIEEILEIANGIMIARGDLGVEIPPEEVPIVQKRLIQMANRKGKPVITATQMLESMIKNPRPTRAEANDVANAVFDGTDTLMLSGETAMGEYPVEAVQMMSKIAETAEGVMNYSKTLHNHSELSHKTVTNAISHSACTLASDLNAACIATVTKSGFTGRMLSKFRPDCPIVACTSEEKVWRKLSLVWGCVPSLLEGEPPNDKVFEIAIKQCVNAKAAKTGDTVIIASGLPIGLTGSTNTLRAELVGNIYVKGRGVGQQPVTARACVVKALAEAEKYFKPGDILVAPNTDNQLMPFIKKASAIVVGAPESNDYSHAEITAQALDIPVIISSERVVEMIPQGTTVTVAPQEGCVYNGVPGI